MKYRLIMAFILLPFLLIGGNTQPSKAGFVFSGKANQNGDKKVYLPLVYNNFSANYPQPVIILSNHTTYYDDYDWRIIVGEVENTSSQNLQGVTVNGKIIANGMEYANVPSHIFQNVLRGNDRTCFVIYLPEPDAFQGYSVQVVGSVPANLALADLVLLNQQGVYSAADSWYEITGSMRNQSSKKATNLIVAVTLYNQDGKVLDCDYWFPEDSILDPGQETNFTVLVNKNWTPDYYADVVGYRIQLEGELVP